LPAADIAALLRQPPIRAQRPTASVPGAALATALDGFLTAACRASLGVVAATRIGVRSSDRGVRITCGTRTHLGGGRNWRCAPRVPRPHRPPPSACARRRRSGWHRTRVGDTPLAH
jgi:hypothetical protein